MVRMLWPPGLGDCDGAFARYGPLTSPKLGFRSADPVSVQPLSVRTGTENAGAKKTV
jgi:hypothetical protein